MSDFDSKLDSLKRGTDGLKAPEGFDAALNAKLVAAAALPPAAAGAGLAWGLKLLIGVIAFSAAGGAAWLATGDSREHRPPSSSVVAEAVPGVPPVPRPSVVPWRRDAPGSKAPPEVSNVGQPATPTELLKPEGTVSSMPPGADAGAGGESLTVVSEAIAVASRAKVSMCGRQVDRVELFSQGPAADGIHKWSGKSDRMLTMLSEAKGFRLGKPGAPEILVVGRFVTEGGPGLRGFTGDFPMIDDWFVATGMRSDRLEVVVNEYRPIVFTLNKLEPGSHYVGDVHLQWVGNRPEDGRTLKVTVTGEGAPMATVRLFPMWCDTKGKWQPGWGPLEDLPASGAVYTHMSATRYRVAAYAPGAQPAWKDVSLYAAPNVSETLTLRPERPALVELASGLVEVPLSKPWRAAPGIDLWFHPGRETGSLCLDLGSDLRGVAVKEPVSAAQPMKEPELSRHAERCLVFGETMVWQSEATKKWVAVKFSR